MTAIAEEAGRLLTAVRERRPRVHCLTNSVVQKFTADGLTALGAVPSMTQSLDEVADFAAQADALLVNLGTLDPARRSAIEAALEAFTPTGRPWTLDPVHCELSPRRLAFARDLLARGPAVVRGNAAEMAVIGEAPAGTVAIRTGAVDRLVLDRRRLDVKNGHPLMAKVTGTGCLAGAIVASFLALREDRLASAAAALLVFGVAAEIAAETARGPGSFAVALLDAVANLTPQDVIARGGGRSMKRLDYRLNAIVDAGTLVGADLPALARAAAEGGATLIQYRDKTGSTREMIERAGAIRAALAGTGVPFVVNDRVDVALAAGADGVHLGRDDMDAATARRLLGPDAILGLTVKNEADARVAAAAPVDYACVGGVFETLSKDNPDPPVGLGGLSTLIATIRESRPDLPIGAIAGIDLSRVPGVVAAGADGIAAISAIFKDGDPRGAAAAFLAAVDAALKGRESMTAIALTIAGSDSGGGAGIQADLKTFSALGVYGASVLTAITAQNTHGVTAVEMLSPAIVAAQIDAVLSDLSVGAIKIGMAGNAATIEAIAAALARHERSVVLDPVMVATSGDRLLADEAVAALREGLAPRALLVTPNLPEAALLSRSPIAEDEAAMARQAEAIMRAGARAVLIKGGHLRGAESVDLLFDGSEVHRFAARRIDTTHDHGTGCTLAAAITARLALGEGLAAAVSAAKDYLTEALKRADELTVGSGRGPVHHFHAWWPRG